MLIQKHSNSKKQTTPVIIIGGGIAGLICAVHLVERGIKPLMLEAEPRWIGGRLGNKEQISFDYRDKTWQFPTEHAIHGIWSPYLNFKRVLTKFNIHPALIPAKEETWIYGRGKKIRKVEMGSAIRNSIIPAPFHYLQLFARPRFMNILTLRDFASLFRVMGSLFSAMAIDPIAEHKSLYPMTLADFMNGWSPTMQSFFRGLARNALAGSADEIPASSFIAFLRFYTLLRRDAWAYDYMPTSGGTYLAEPLAKVARLGGCKIRMAATAIDMAKGKNDDTWQVTYQLQEQQYKVQASHVVLALDSPATEKLLSNSDTTAEITENMQFPDAVSTVIFRLWFDKKPAPIAEAGIFTGDFLMDNFFWLERIFDDYKKWEDIGGSIVEMHIYRPLKEVELPDAVLLARVITDIHRAFPELRGHLVHSTIQRNDPTQTIFSVGEPGKHLAVNTPWKNMFACGDWIYHPAPPLYLERSVTTGIAAANGILASMGLDEWEILEHPKPEWLAGIIAKGWFGVRQRMLRSKKEKQK